MLLRAMVQVKRIQRERAMLWWGECGQRAFEFGALLPSRPLTDGKPGEKRTRETNEKERSILIAGPKFLLSAFPFHGSINKAVVACNSVDSVKARCPLLLQPDPRFLALHSPFHVTLIQYN